MEEIYKVIWNDNEVGEFSFSSRDMWYMEGRWTSLHTVLSTEFEEKLKGLGPKLLMENPEIAPKVILQNITEPAVRLYCLATFFDEKSLCLRQIISKEALEIFFPNRY